MCHIWKCVLAENIKDFKHLVLSDISGYITYINMKYLGREKKEKSDTCKT